IDLAVYIDPAIASAYRGDPTRIRQILLNLVGNAVKFTEAGGVSVAVSPLGVASVRFEIRDTGIGMTEAVRARLFEKFTQADNSITRRYGGTGLGLAICKQLVELMGGRIGVDSQPGAGSCFWFELPLTPGPAATEPARPTRHLEGLRALAVDDVAM